MFRGLAFRYRPCFVVFFLLSFAVLAFAQGARRPKDADDAGETDRPAARERYFRRGRTVPGHSAAALRYRAYKDKMGRRAAARSLTVSPRSGSLAPLGPSPASPSPAGPAWVPLGPAPIGLDSSSGQDFGVNTGRVTSIAVDQNDPTGNTVYAGAAYGGLWKSSNAANPDPSAVQWTPLIDDQATLSVGAIALKPGDSNTILVGTGEANGSGDSYYGLGILRSTDGGATWDLITSTSDKTKSFKGLAFSKMAFSTDNPNLVVAATANSNATTRGIDTSNIRGIYYSTDAGATWQYATVQDNGVTITPGSASSVIYHPALHKFFAAVRYHGYYSSIDGAHWTRLAAQPSTILGATTCPASYSPNCPIYRGEIAIQPVTGDIYTWFVDVNNFNRGIYRSFNGGATWSSVGTTGIDSCGDPSGCGTRDQGYYDLELAAVPNGTGTDLYAGAINIYKCSLSSVATACSTWLNLTHVYGCTVWGQPAHVHPDQHGLDFSRALPKVMYFGHDGGVSRALNGPGLLGGACTSHNAFDNLSGTLGSLTEFLSFSQHPTDESTVLGGAQDVGSAAVDSTHPGLGNLAWMNVNSGDGGFNAINPNNPLEWFTAYTDVSIQRCTSGINCNYTTFLPVVTNLKVGGDHGDFYTPYILDPGMPSKIIVGTCRVWRGNSDGTGWTSANVLTTNFDTGTATACTGSESNLVTALAGGGPLGANGSQVIYAGTDNGYIFSTMNAGGGPSTWTSQPTPGNYKISDIAVDPNDPTGKTAYATAMGFSSPHVFKTTNGGQSWSYINGDLPDAPADSVVVDPNDPTIVYVGTDVGVFVTSNGGMNWTEWGTALPNVPVTRIRAFISPDGSSKKLRVSTYGRGVWETDLVSATGDFTLQITSSSPVNVLAGQTFTLSGVLKSKYGYSSPVTLSCSGDPLPATCAGGTFTPTPAGTPFTISVSDPSAQTFSFNVHAAGSDPGTTTHDKPFTTNFFTVTISPPAPTPVTIKHGKSDGSTSFVITVSDNFSDTLLLGCDPSAAPAGIYCFPTLNNFNTSNLSFAYAKQQTVGLYISVPAFVVQVGSFPIGFTVTLPGGGSVTQTQTLDLALNPRFAITLSPNGLSLKPGQPGSVGYTVNSIDGYAGTVNVSCAALEGTCALAPGSFSSFPGTGLLSITTPSSVLGQGDYYVAVTGTDGTLTTPATGLNVTLMNYMVWGAPGGVIALPGSTASTHFWLNPYTFDGQVAATCDATALDPAATCTVTGSPFTLVHNGMVIQVPVTLSIPANVSQASGTITLHTYDPSYPSLAHDASLHVDVPFSLVSYTPLQQVLAGQTSNPYQLSLQGGVGFSAPVTLGCTGLPAGATCSFSPSSLTISSNPTSFSVSVVTNASLPVADYNFSITATASGATRSVQATLEVGDFGLSVTPSVYALAPGAFTQGIRADVTSVNNYTGSVTVNCPAGLPAGVSCQGGYSTGAGGQAYVGITVASTVPPQTLNVALVATSSSGNVSRYANVTLAIQDMAVTVTPSPQTASPASPITLTANVAGINGFALPVFITCRAGQPAAPPSVPCSASPSVITPGQPATLTLTPSGDQYPSSVTVTVDATSTLPQFFREGTATLNFIDFYVLPPTSAPSIQAGGSTTLTFSAKAFNGFSSPLTLTCDAGGAPGVTCNVGNPVVTPTPSGVSVPVQVTTPTAPPSAQYQVTVTATGGGITHHSSQYVYVNGFHVVATPGTNAVPDGGGSVLLSATAASDGAATTVAWSCPSPPPGISCLFSPTSVSIPVNGTNTSSLTVNVGSSVPHGTVPLTVRGDSAGLSYDTTVQLVVGSDFQITNLTPSATVVQGQSQIYSLRVASPNGFSQPVTLSCAGLPDGAACAFDINPVTPTLAGQAVTITVSTTGAVAPNTYSFTVSGTAGSTVYTASPSPQLVVASVPDFRLTASPSLMTTMPGGFPSSALYPNVLGGLPASTSVDVTCGAISDPTVTCSVSGVGRLDSYPVAFVNFSTTAATPVSDISITVHAVQHGGTLAHDIPLTLRVSDYSVSSPAPVSAPQGGAANFSFTVTSLNHLTGTFYPSCSNLPVGLGPCIFTPSNIVLGSDPATFVVSVPVGTNAALGQSTFQITFGGSHSVTASLTVLPVQDFSFTATSPAVQPATAGQTLTWALQLTPQNAYAGNVSLSVSGCPAGAVCSLSPTTPVALANGTSQTATATMQVPASAGIGNLGFTLTATDPASHKTHSIGLTASIGTFSVTATPSSLTATPGSYAQFTASASGQNFQFPLTLACTGLPPGLTCNLNPAQITVGQSSVVVVPNVAGIAPATSTFNLTATAVGTTKTIPITYRLVDYSLTSTTSSAAVNAASSVAVSLKATSQNGFNSSISMSCPSLPVGINCTFTPSSLVPLATGSTINANILTTATMPAGVYSIPLTAFGTASHAVNFTLTVKNFHASVQPDTAITPGGGGKATYNLTFFADQGFNSVLSLSCVSPPTGVTCAFSPTTVTPTQAGAPVKLTVTVASTVPQGSKSLNIRAASGSLAQVIPVTLLAGADFSLATVTGQQTVQQTQPADFHITATAVGGMNQPVTLSCTGLPAGATCAFSSNPLTPTAGGQDVDVTVQTTLSSVPNTYTITVQGVGGGVTHSTNLSLNLQPLPDFVLNTAAPVAATRPGQSAVFSASISKNGAFTSIVDLTCGGTLPAGATCQVQPSSVDFSGTSAAPVTVTVTTPANASLSDTPFVLHGLERGGAKTHDLALTLRVNDFHLSAPTPLTFAQTDTASYTVTVFADNQFSSPVTLSCNNLPVNVGPCGFSSNNFVPASNGTAVTVSLPVGGLASAGPTSFDVVASGGNATHTITEPLNIILVQDFTVGTMSPLTQTAIPGQTVGWGILLTPLNSFAASVNLAAACPSGFTCTFQPSPPVALANGMQQAVNFLVQVPATAAAVNSNITLTATDPVSGKSHALIFTVQVQGLALTVSPTSASVAPGAGAIFNVTLNGLNGFNQQVLIGCNNPPVGITCSAAVGTPGQTLPITVMSASNASGAKSVQFGAALGLGAPITLGLKNVSLNVSSFLASYLVTTTSAAQTAPLGSTATYRLAVRSTKSTFTSTVTLSCLPTWNLSCSFSPASFSPSLISRNVVLTVTPNPQLNPGSYPFTVQAIAGGQVRQLAMTLNVADFWITANPALQLIPDPNGGTATYTVTAQTYSNFNLPVTLSCPGAPAGVTCAFVPASVTPTQAGASSTLTVTTTAGSPKGLLDLTVQAAAGSLAHQYSIQLTNGQDFSLSFTPPSLTISAGGNDTANINVNAIGPFTAPVVLACVGVSPQASLLCTFPAPGGSMGTPGSSTPLNINVLAGVPGGVYTVSVQGMGGGLTHTANFTVNVPDFSLGVNRDLSVPDVVVGGAAVYHGTLTAIAGYSGNVTVTCTAPSPLTCANVPTSPIAPAGAGTPFMFSVTVPNGTPTGNYSVQVDSSDGAGHLHHASDTFAVKDYHVSFDSSAATLEAGASTSFGGAVTGINGYTGAVQLSCPPDLPDLNITCSFTPALVSASASGTPFSATISTAPATTPGSHTVELTKAGSRVVRTTPFALTVTPTNDFNVAIAPGARTVNAGDSLSFGMNVTAVNAFDATVTMTCSGAPAGMTCTPPPPFAVPPGGSFSMQVHTILGTIVPGTYNLTLTSSGGGKTHEQTLTVIVRDFSISATPPTQQVLPGAEADYSVSMSSDSGFAAGALFTCSIAGSPAGAACSFDQPNLTAGASTTLRVTSTADTPPGPYTVNLAATSGATVHNSSVSVQIGGPDFTLSPDSLSVNFISGFTNIQTAIRPITVTPLYGFSSPVTFSCSPVYTGATCSVTSSVTPVPSGSSVTVTLRIPRSAPAATRLYTITATGGGQAHTIPITVNVN